MKATTFKELNIKPEFVKALAEIGIKEPTQIQSDAIPFLINYGTDFIGQAQTGTGKTAAYSLPILNAINPKNDKIQALILSPTRELALQIKKQIFKFTKYSDKIFAEAVYGGEPIGKQIRALKRPTQILIATPGRLIELLEKKEVILDYIKTLVLDEADEMLSLGFKKELNKILNFTKGQRNTWLFSATIPEDIKQLIKDYMAADAHRIKLSRQKSVNKSIDHQYLVCTENKKYPALRQFLKTQGKHRGIIFCNTKKSAKTLFAEMEKNNYRVGVIHGDLKQIEREKVMRSFKNESTQILVATDLTARGIDIKELAYVAHYNVPDQPEYYTHRSGRTGRAGNRGLSILFVSPDETKKLRYIERILGIAAEKIST